MIILEGADGTGKTTLAHSLAQKMSDIRGVPVHECYAHMSRPPEDFDHVRGYMNVTPRVQDRFHLGAVVYGAILGGGTYPSAERMRLVQNYLRWQGCLVVILYAERDVLRRRLRDSVKHEMYGHDQILTANDAYRALAMSSNRGSPYCDRSLDVSMAWPSEDFAKALIAEWSARWRGTL